MTKLHIFNTQSQTFHCLEGNDLHTDSGEDHSTIDKLVINGPVCQTLSAPMPVKQARQIIKALPFALEEQLANEIDNNHIHYIGREGNDAFALVCELTAMDYLISQYDPNAMLYFPLLLPQIEQGICVCILDGIANIRFSKYGTISVTPDIVTLALDKLKTDGVSTVEFYDLDDTYNLLPLEIENIGYEVQQPDTSALFTHIEKAAAGYQWNLLSGVYTKKKAPVKTKHSKLKAPLAIAATLVVTVFFIQLIQMKQYQQMSDLVSDASRSFYTTLFPGENVRSLRRQFRDKLESSNGGPVSSAGFIALLADATKSIQTDDSIEWSAVRFTRKKNTLEINLIVDNIAKLDSMKQKMTSNGLSVDIASATNTGKRVKGVLKVSKNG